jgi:hypothetical protein
MPTCSSKSSGNAVSIPDCSLSPVRLRRAPVIEQYENERQVEYVFDAKSYRQWIEKGEEPLRSASILARNSGITRVEMLNLEKDCVLIRRRPDEDGNWGDLVIKLGFEAAGQEAGSED